MSTTKNSIISMRLTNKNSFNHIKRKWYNIFTLIFLYSLSFIAAVPFLFIVYYLLQKGLSGITLNFFMDLPKPPGEPGGGMANAIIGSLIVVGMASIIGIPWGIGMGIYLSEYKNTKTAKILKIVINLLISAPSIVLGIFIYNVIVVKYGFSSYAGAATLFLIMLPIIARGTEEILKMIPHHIREAGLALGVPRWKVIIYILIPGAISMIVTVIMLAIARIAGETAPLLFTALGNQYHISSLTQPIATLPVQIYEFSKSGFKEMETQAWAGALVLVMFIFFINFLIRVILFFYKKRHL